MSSTTVKEWTQDLLKVRVYATTDEMGAAAAKDTAAAIRDLLAVKEEVNIIFAAAPSQVAFLGHLSRERGIDWTRVEAFHMDEYVGLDGKAPQSFGNFLKEHIFGLLPFRAVHYINGCASDTEAECARYSALLRAHPVDIVCLGIGENGHIAFNDPGVADFNDPADVKKVALDATCRQQQVNEKCFPTLDDVPTHALTLTVPALLRAGRMFCVVPFPGKASAVRNALKGPVSENCPASILRTKDAACLYLNSESASLL